MTINHIVIEPFNGDQELADAVAAYHLEIRRQQISDGENDFAVKDIHDSQADLKSMQSVYIEPGGNFFIAFDEKTRDIAGFIGIRKVDETEGELKRMAVLPHYRRQRIGTRLVHTAMDWARANRFKKLFLYTGKDEKAIYIYKAAGFKLGPYRPERQDYLMTLDLS